MSASFERNELLKQDQADNHSEPQHFMMFSFSQKSFQKCLVLKSN